MRHIRNNCPRCGGAYDFKEEECGRETTCPHCGAEVRLRYKKSVGEHLWEWVLRALMIGGVLLAISYNQLLTTITAVGFGLLLLGLPLAFIRQTRAAFGQACFWWGFVSACCLVFASFQAVSQLWGGLTATIGLCIGILPIIPMGLLASLCEGEWRLFFGLLLYAILIPLAMFGGPALSDGKRRP